MRRGRSGTDCVVARSRCRSITSEQRSTSGHRRSVRGSGDHRHQALIELRGVSVRARRSGAQLRPDGNVNVSAARDTQLAAAGARLPGRRNDGSTTTTGFRVQPNGLLAADAGDQARERSNLIRNIYARAGGARIRLREQAASHRRGALVLSSLCANGLYIPSQVLVINDGSYDRYNPGSKRVRIEGPRGSRTQ